MHKLGLNCDCYITVCILLAHLDWRWKQYYPPCNLPLRCRSQAKSYFNRLLANLLVTWDTKKEQPSLLSPSKNWFKIKGSITLYFRTRDQPITVPFIVVKLLAITKWHNMVAIKVFAEGNKQIANKKNLFEVEDDQRLMIRHTNAVLVSKKSGFNPSL